MMTIYAFPSGHNPQRGRQEDGMLLRDYFASDAMKAHLSNPETIKAIAEERVNALDICKASYNYADLMLKARDE